MIHIYTALTFLRNILWNVTKTYYMLKGIKLEYMYCINAFLYSTYYIYRGLHIKKKYRQKCSFTGATKMRIK